MTVTAVGDTGLSQHVLYSSCLMTRLKQPSALSLGPEGEVGGGEERGQGLGKFSPKVSFHRNTPKYTNMQSLGWMSPFSLNFGGLTNTAV